MHSKECSVKHLALIFRDDKYAWAITHSRKNCQSHPYSYTYTHFISCRQMWLGNFSICRMGTGWLHGHIMSYLGEMNMFCSNSCILIWPWNLRWLLSYLMSTHPPVLWPLLCNCDGNWKEVHVPMTSLFAHRGSKNECRAGKSWVFIMFQSTVRLCPPTPMIAAMVNIQQEIQQGPLTHSHPGTECFPIQRLQSSLEPSIHDRVG